MKRCDFFYSFTSMSDAYSRSMSDANLLLKNRLFQITVLFCHVMIFSCATAPTNQNKLCVRQYDAQLSKKYNLDELDRLYDAAKFSFYYTAFATNSRLIVSNDSVVWDTVPYCHLDFCLTQSKHAKVYFEGMTDTSELVYFATPVINYKYSIGCGVFQITQLQTGQTYNCFLSNSIEDISLSVLFSDAKSDTAKTNIFVNEIRTNSTYCKWLKEHQNLIDLLLE